LNRELDKSVLPAYFVGPGDTLVVESISFDSPIRFPSDQLVLADGTIDLGRYGRIVVAGMTVEDIETAVQLRVEDVEEDEVEPINVRLIDPHGAVFYVLGEVNAPGSYPLVGRETVLDAIIAAGGLTNRASPCDIVLTRPSAPHDCRVVLPICYRQITQIGDTTTNYQVMPGDRITVATRGVCEELQFWKAKETCELCNCHQQCPCPDPSEPHAEDQVFQNVPESPELVRRPKPSHRRDD
jgi:protein involved in polysaccharide export with SLBB domain